MKILFFGVLLLGSLTCLAEGFSLGVYGRILSSQVVKEKSKILTSNGYEFENAKRIQYSHEIGDGDQLEVSFIRYKPEGVEYRRCYIAVLPVSQLAPRFVVCGNP
jgi:hypothetical protein